MALTLNDVKDLDTAARFAEEQMKAGTWDPDLEQMLVQMMPDLDKDKLMDRMDELVKEYKIKSGV